MVWPVMPGGNSFFYDGFFRSTALVSTLAGQVGSTFSDGGTTGAIVFYVFSGSDAGAANLSITSDKGGTVAYYDDAGVALVQGATTTSATGAGYIFAVPAGDVNLTVNGATGLTCGPSGKAVWPATKSGAAVEAPVVAGSLTVARISCQ
jgi:hypothetical protein